MKKRIICLFTVLAMLIGSMPLIATAASTGTCGDSVTWTLDDEGTLTISGKGDMKDYPYYSSAPWYNSRSSIVSVIIESGVTSIGDYAFFSCYNLTIVTIGSGLTNIGSDVFWNCENLTSITIPDGVTSIGDSAFSNCKGLTSITIPDSVTSISSYAFYNCSSLTSITIPDSVTSIGGWAFDGCTGLTSVTIPDSITSIGYRAFYGCSGLTSIDVSSNNSTYFSSDGVLFNKDQTELICCPGGKSGSYVIPDSVTSISCC